MSNTSASSTFQRALSKAISELSQHAAHREDAELDLLIKRVMDYAGSIDVHLDELHITQERESRVIFCLQSLLDMLPEPALELTSQAMVLKLNPRAQQLLAPDFHPLRHQRCLLQAIRASDQPVLLQALKAGHADEDASMHVTWVDGNAVRVRLHLLPWDISDTSSPRFLVLLDDVSSEAPNALDHDLLQGLMDESVDLMYVTDVDGRLILANKALGRWTGREVDTLAGQSIEELLGPASLQDRLDDLIKLGQRVDSSMCISHPVTGKPVDLSLHRFPIFDLDKGLIGIGGMCRDTSLDRLHEYQTLLADTIFQECLDALFTMDAEKRLQRWNPAFARITEHEPQSLENQTIDILSPQAGQALLSSDAMFELRRVGRWLGETMIRNRSGNLIPVWARIIKVGQQNHQESGLVGILTDLSDLRQAEAERERVVNHDPLTGLPNRSVLRRVMLEAIVEARRIGSHFALIFIDLDHFKSFNDTLGHTAGDRLLIQIAQRLATCLAPNDHLARLSGDEFVMLIPNVSEPAAVKRVQQIVDTLSVGFDIGKLTDYHAQASIGVVIYPQHGVTDTELLRNAELAMYEAKRLGRNCMAVFSRDLEIAARKHFDITTALLPALANGELELHLQPVFRLADGQLMSAEALIRWNRSDGVRMRPDQFLPAAQQAGLMPRIGRWVMQEATRLLVRLSATGHLPEDFSLSINQTAQDLEQEDLLPRLEALLHQHGLRINQIQFELTEDELASRRPALMRNLAGLRDMGVVLAVDDFGTGYSNLAYLKTLPINMIKIDQSFIRDMIEDRGDHAVVAAIISLSHTLGYQTTAEGIETESQRAILADLGCEFGQGYLFGRPMEVAEFERFLQKSASLPPDTV